MGVSIISTLACAAIRTQSTQRIANDNGIMPFCYLLAEHNLEPARDVPEGYLTSPGCATPVLEQQ